MKKLDYCVFIGRFSIFHHAHNAIIKQALSISDKVIVGIGSSGGARTTRNPFTADERQEMISLSFPKEDLERIIFVKLKDILYKDTSWTSMVQTKIEQITGNGKNVGLIGFESDETSFYLRLFPQFKYIEHGTEYKFHSTDIRDKYFSHDKDWESMVPNGARDFLERFKKTEHFVEMKKEKDYIDNYKESFRGAPFPIIFSTADCLVMKSAHILVIRRGRNPGKGLLGIPGGFIGQKETIKDAALRELKEETGIKVNLSDLRRAIIDSKTFDDPNRSDRGRVITNAFLIDLGSGPLPEVKGDDDAMSAEWLPLSDFYTLEDLFFEDHYHIILNLISKY